MARPAEVRHLSLMNSLRPLLICTLVVTEVGIWQWRMVIAHRGRRIYAVLLGFLGAALQITAITQVVSNVHDVLSDAAYAGGVGCGVLLGIVAGERLTPGRLEVTIVSALPTLTEHLWIRGWGATAYNGRDRRDRSRPYTSRSTAVMRPGYGRTWSASTP